MANGNEEIRKKLLEAKSADEIFEVMTAAGEKITAEEAKMLFEKAQEQKADKMLSLEELESVSGGEDRDWAKEGCAATVEGVSSWCKSNDWCFFWDVTYSTVPTDTPCPKCKGQTYATTWNYKCINCKSTFDSHWYDITP